MSIIITTDEAGGLGGAICGFLILIPEFSFGFGRIPEFPEIPYVLGGALFLGGIYGGAFGLITFPICYYLFLKRVPLKLSLAVTIPATIIAAWIGDTLPRYQLFPSLNSNWIINIYGPGFLGLLLSSVFLWYYSRHSRASGP